MLQPPLKAGTGIRQRNIPRRPSVFVIGALLVAWIMLLFLFRFEFYGLVSMKPRPWSPGKVEREVIYAYAAAVIPENDITIDDLAVKSRTAPLFICNEGRKGLHVIHTRFLLGQYEANTTFIASRLMLLSTFFVPSLNAQTTSNFIVIASFDSRIPVAAIESLRAELRHLKVPVLLHSQSAESLGRSNNAAVLSYSTMVPMLITAGVLTQDVLPLDFYVTSRMDADDAVHIQAVQGVQNIACSAPNHRNYKLQVAYIRAGSLWTPSPEPSSMYGEVAVQDPEPRYLAILQSMIAGRGMEKCPLNVYSHQHMQPYTLGNVSDTQIPGCPFIFRCSRNIHIWESPEGELSSLYIRTATSSTRDKNKTSTAAWQPAQINMLRHFFGLDESKLLVTNMVLAGLEREAVDTLIAKNSRKW